VWEAVWYVPGGIYQRPGDFVLISLQDFYVRVAGCAPQCYAIRPYGFDDDLVEQKFVCQREL